MKRGTSATYTPPISIKKEGAVKKEDAGDSAGDTGLAVPLTSIEARLALASAFFRQKLEEASAFAAAISTAMPYTLEMPTLTGELERLSSAHIADHGAPRSRRQKELGELIMRLTLPEKSKAKQSAAPHTQALVFLAWHMVSGIEIARLVVDSQRLFLCIHGKWQQQGSSRHTH